MVKKAINRGSFTVFVLLLVVLLISVMFTKYLPLEGFINYKQDLSQLTSVIIPPYTNTRNIIKLYDSVYYDDKTGHVLELFGSSDSTLPDTDGSSLTNMVLMPRSDTDVIHYNVMPGNTFSNNVIESQYIQSSLVSSYGSWYYPNAGSIGTLNFNYQVMYFPWKTDTVLFIYDILAKKIVGCVPFLKESTTRLITTTQSVPTNYVSDKHPQNGKYVEVLPQYQNKLNGYAGAVTCNKMYQICGNVWFDTDNAVLVMHTSNGSDVTLDTTASFTINDNTDTSITKCAFLNDETGRNLILSIPFSRKRTMVCVLSLNEDESKLLSIRRVMRFDPSVAGGIDGVTPSSDTNVTSAPGGIVDPESGKWMLKSQCMPPVCPACPSCNCGTTATSGPSPTTCVNCQGKNSLSSLIANSYTASDRWKQGGAGGGSGGPGPVTSLITGTRDVLVGAENTVGNVVDTAVGGTALLGLGAIGGVAEVAGDVTGLGGEVVGGTAGIANNLIDSVESIVNNAMNDLTQRIAPNTEAPLPPEEEEDLKKCKEDTHKKRHKKTTPPPATQCASPAVPGGYQMGQGPGLNNYYGALGGRGASEFMPVTSDFSKFGR